MTRFPPSQLDAIKLAALGMPNSEIATTLGVKPQTVTTRMHRALLHTGVGGRHGLVAQACRWGQLQDLPPQSDADPSALLADLDLLGCFVSGLTTKQACHRLHLSCSGVDSRTRRLRSAIGARDRAHAVLIAWQWRIWPEARR